MSSPRSGAWRDEHRSADGFLAFLRQHRAVADLIADADLIDVMSLKQLSYGTQRFRDLFLRLEDELEREGRFHRENVDAFTGDFPTMRCAEGLGSDASARYASARRALARAGETFDLTRARALALLGRPAEPPSLPIKHYLTGRSLIDP